MKKKLKFIFLTMGIFGMVSLSNSIAFGMNNRENMVDKSNTSSDQEGDVTFDANNIYDVYNMPQQEDDWDKTLKQIIKNNDFMNKGYETSEITPYEKTASITIYGKNTQDRKDILSNANDGFYVIGDDINDDFYYEDESDDSGYEDENYGDYYEAEYSSNQIDEMIERISYCLNFPINDRYVGNIKNKIDYYKKLLLKSKVKYALFSEKVTNEEGKKIRIKFKLTKKNNDVTIELIAPIL